MRNALGEKAGRGQAGERGAEAVQPPDSSPEAPSQRSELPALLPACWRSRSQEPADLASRRRVGRRRGSQRRRRGGGVEGEGARERGQMGAGGGLERKGADRGRREGWTVLVRASWRVRVRRDSGSRAESGQRPSRTCGGRGGALRKKERHQRGRKRKERRESCWGGSPCTGSGGRGALGCLRDQLPFPWSFMGCVSTSAGGLRVTGGT